MDYFTLDFSKLRVVLDNKKHATFTLQIIFRRKVSHIIEPVEPAHTPQTLNIRIFPRN